MGILRINMKNIIAVLIATIILFSCDSNKNITSFKIKNPYLSTSKIITENVSISIFPGNAGGIEQNVNRWIDIGIIDYLSEDNIIIIEWPSFIKEILPENTIDILMNHISEFKRRIKIRV